MLLLVSTSDKVQVITGSAGAIDVHASWMDNVGGAVTPGRTNTKITTSATTDVVAPPAASSQRNVKTLHIRNLGITSNMITVQHTDGTTVSQLHRTLLAPETTLQYIDEIGFIVSSTAAAGAITLTPPSAQGRLTLVAGTPVMTTTQTAKTVLYYSPYNGNQVPIYSGTAWTQTAFAELSAVTTDATKSPAAIGVSKVNDWFVWNDAGTLRLGHGTDWASDTDRSSSTGITRLNGIWVNAAAITNGPGINLGTYVGTTRSNASSQLDWIYGAIAANGGAGFFGVWNCYNRIEVVSISRDSTSTWSYGTGAWRAANNSASIRNSYVSGLAEDVFESEYHALSATIAGNPAVGVGYDTTTAASGIYPALNSSGYTLDLAGAFGTNSLGFHFMSALEYGSLSGYGTGVFPSSQSGLYFKGMM